MGLRAFVFFCKSVQVSSSSNEDERQNKKCVHPISHRRTRRGLQLNRLEKELPGAGGRVGAVFRVIQKKSSSVCSETLAA